MSTNTFSPGTHTMDGKNIEPLSKGKHIIVVGAGAFGGWSALYLLRKGYNVTVVDAWGPGNSRSSSGDETRVIRSTYGANERYFDMNVRALTLWKEHEQQWNTKLFHNKGVLWMCYQQYTPTIDDSIPFSKKHRMEYEYLDKNELKKRYSIVNTSDLSHAWFDPYGGCLRAREAMQTVHKAFIAEGGNYHHGFAKPGLIHQNRIQDIQLSDGTTMRGDVFLFACGSWLGTMFSDILKDVITCTKQEVYYFGVPHEHAKAFEKFPVWVDVDGSDFYYGIPGNNFRGFKIGVDKRGELFDPTHGDRIVNPEVLQKARKFIEHRFPLLKNAPLVENRVCPYENSPDGNFLFDQHPEANNLFFLGGGSGHGFKHGPALGELVSLILSGNLPIPHDFLLKQKILTQK